MTISRSGRSFEIVQLAEKFVRRVRRSWRLPMSADGPLARLAHSSHRDSVGVGSRDFGGDVHDAGVGGGDFGRERYRIIYRTTIGACAEELQRQGEQFPSGNSKSPNRRG